MAGQLNQDLRALWPFVFDAVCLSFETIERGGLK